MTDRTWKYNFDDGERELERKQAELRSLFPFLFYFLGFEPHAAIDQNPIQP